MSIIVAVVSMGKVHSVICLPKVGYSRLLVFRDDILLNLSYFCVRVLEYIHETEFDDTVFVYYNGQDDSIVQSGAIARCMQAGGELVMPKDPSLNIVVSGLATATIWMGLGDWGAEGSYEWLDGSRVSWANWANKQPDNAHGSEDCTLMFSKGFWNDDNCQDHFGYICQIPITPASAYSYSHFTFHEDESTYKQAVDACSQTDSRLVISDFDNVDAFLEKTSRFSDQNAFWVNTKDISNQCSTASTEGIKVEECQHKMPFVCELVEPHNMLITAERPVVKNSSNWEMDCSVSGYPVPEVTWYRGNTPVESQIKSAGHSFLVLRNVKPDDAGLYECRATNKINDEEYKVFRYSVLTVLPRGQ